MLVHSLVHQWKVWYSLKRDSCAAGGTSVSPVGEERNDVFLGGYERSSNRKGWQLLYCTTIAVHAPTLLLLPHTPRTSGAGHHVGDHRLRRHRASRGRQGEGDGHEDRRAAASAGAVKRRRNRGRSAWCRPGMAARFLLPPLLFFSFLCATPGTAVLLVSQLPFQLVMLQQHVISPISFGAPPPLSPAPSPPTPPGVFCCAMLLVAWRGGLCVILGFGENIFRSARLSPSRTTSWWPQP